MKCFAYIKVTNVDSTQLIEFLFLTFSILKSLFGAHIGSFFFFSFSFFYVHLLGILVYLAYLFMLIKVILLLCYNIKQIKIFYFSCVEEL